MTKVALALRTWVMAYVCAHVHRHIVAYTVKVSEAYEKQVFCNNGWGLERIPHRLGADPNPIFSTIKSLTWYIFKTHRNPTRKT